MSNKHLLYLLVFFVSCQSTAPNEDTLFVQEEFSFKNELLNEQGFDVFRYRNYFNGGGVGIGDFNKDGLADMYLTANQTANKLYFNKGNFEFEDVTEQSGTAGNRPWSTGVAVADINGDGWLDIYVCNSGNIKGDDRGNELFINNQDGTFTEQATNYGLADTGFSTHAAFFDYDQDGDLDCYMLNNSFRPVSSLPIENIRDQRDTYGGGDKFYRNDNGKFIDISNEVGVFGSVIGFGLGITLLDVNDDSYTDIYVSNDFFERDYLYINQAGKSFREALEEYIDHTSVFSMGADAADLNNDGYEEIFVTDMLPEKSKRLKQTTKFDSYDLYRRKLAQGFYHQYMKNSLQMGQPDGTFVEIGRLKGVSATDWSWGCLLFDMDNDGYRDIFVANGIYKDVTDQDFIDYFASEENMSAAKANVEDAFEKFNEKMPSNPQPNYTFTRNASGEYVNKAQEWGLATPSFSNGAAYADFNNDGFLDLVVNNLNQPSFLYKNQGRKSSSSHSVRIQLHGEKKNPFGIGAQIRAHIGDQVISYSHYPTRGFQSSMDYNITLGVGEAEQLDSLIIRWDSNRRSKWVNVPADSLLTLSMEEAVPFEFNSRAPKETIFTNEPISIAHQENFYIDFDRHRLLYHQLSIEGPALAVADVNGDGLDDFYFGGATGQAGGIFVNTGKDDYELLIRFDQDAASEDVDAVFFDADGDKDLDLYVVSGGVEAQSPTAYRDRLYLNEGGTFQRVPFKGMLASGSIVRPNDFDGDGDIDLFVGSRSLPNEYGKVASSYLYENDGTGKLEEATGKFANQLTNLGMVTDAQWFDYDQDGDQDLAIVGEWMPIQLFENKGNFFQKLPSIKGLENTKGWWQSLKAIDINGDGLKDLVAGNWGLNSKFQASKEYPIRLYINDFDENGTLEQIYTFFEDGKYRPYHLRGDLTKQLVSLKKKFPSYASYRDKGIKEIFTPEQLESAIVLEAEELASIVAINQGDGSFRSQLLPPRAQYSPIFAIEEVKEESQGLHALLLLGNFSGTRPEEGVYDANHGILLDLADDLKPISQTKSGLSIRGDVRAAVTLKGQSSKQLIIGLNNRMAKRYSYGK